MKETENFKEKALKKNFKVLEGIEVNKEVVTVYYFEIHYIIVH